MYLRTVYLFPPLSWENVVEESMWFSLMDQGNHSTSYAFLFVFGLIILSKCFVGEFLLWSDELKPSSGRNKNAGPHWKFFNFLSSDF